MVYPLSTHCFIPINPLDPGTLFHGSRNAHRAATVASKVLFSWSAESFMVNRNLIRLLEDDDLATELALLVPAEEVEESLLDALEQNNKITTPAKSLTAESLNSMTNGR